MQQVLPLLPRPEAAVDGECYTPEAESPPLAASTFPNIEPGVLRTVSQRKYVDSLVYFDLYLQVRGDLDKITNEIILSGENSKLNKSRVPGATLFLPKHVEQILRHRENEDLHLLQRILLCGSVEVRCHYSCIDNVDIM